jgi:hypothetical protein
MENDKPNEDGQETSYSDTEWDNRILCGDGNCIGVIGPLKKTRPMSPAKLPKWMSLLKPRSMLHPWRIQILTTGPVVNFAVTAIASASSVLMAGAKNVERLWNDA